VILSVIIPAFNREHLIGETLRSLTMQTRLADEIIVVDDGSMDRTGDVAATFGSSVTVIRQANAGPAAARNTGFLASHGEFVHFFDSDDLAAPNKHAVQLAALQATGADIAYGPWIKGRFNGNQFIPSNQVFQQNGLPSESDLIKPLLTRWSVVPHAALFRRTIVERAGGFPEDLFGTEDQQMFLACLLAGARVVHTPDTIEFYREGEAGKITESKDGEPRRLREWARFLLKAREICLHQKIDPVDWFGFRLRAWEVAQDLSCIGVLDEGLQAQLKPLFNGHLPISFYRWQRQLERWLGGLQMRLMGRRASSVFKMDKITVAQVEQLNSLNYHLAGE
jgi:glycosyltransferase involved in cell wall biosynthesis